jgi:hypothetical protein
VTKNRVEATSREEWRRGDEKPRVYGNRFWEDKNSGDGWQ